MKISNYPEVESLNEDDLLVISRPGEGTKSVSIAALAQLLAAGIGNAVANNLNTTEEGYILDARQGKVLGDRFNYSTEDKVVGAWIDGKPIYERTMSFTLPNATSEGAMATRNVAIPSDMNFDRLIAVEGSLQMKNSGRYVPVGYNQSTSVYWSFSIAGGNTFQINNSGMGWNGQTVYVTLRYTKTTD